VKAVEKQTTRVWIVSILAAALVALTAAAAGAEPLVLHYEAFAAGLPIVALDFRVEESGSGYAVDGHIRTVGLLRAFYRVELRAESQGAVAGEAMHPRVHEQVLTTQGKDRVAHLEYPGDGSVTARLVPPEDSGRPKPTPQQTVDTLDPLSTVLAIGHALVGAGRCAGRFPVFDGRRRYDIVLSDEEGAHAPPKEGATLRCRAQAIKIAGFSFDQDYQPHTNNGHVWLAPPRPGSPPLPVRIEFDGSWGLIDVRMTKVEAAK
jgi:Protein of unknown function (DUF3108)